MPPAAPAFVGVDVAKAELVIAIRPSGARWTVANDDGGIRTLLKRLRQHSAALVVLEATGGYERAVVAALAAARLPVVVANPRQVRDFARATGQFAKTDRIDADTLALFGERVRPEPRALPDEAASAFDAPHVWQTAARRAPHSPQNFMLGGLSCWHLGHFMPGLQTVRPVKVERCGEGSAEVACGQQRLRILSKRTTQ